MRHWPTNTTFFRPRHFRKVLLRIAILGSILTSFSFSQWTKVLDTTNPFSTDITYCMFIADTTIFVGSGLNGIVKSSDRGATWQWADFGLPNDPITCMAAHGRSVFAGIYGAGVYYSTNAGTSWNAVNDGLSNRFVESLAFRDSNLFVATHAGVFMYTKTDTAWTARNIGLSNTIVTSIAVRGTVLYAGSFTGEIYTSTDDGTSWTFAKLGYPNSLVMSIVFSGPFVLAGSWDNGIYRSTDNGKSWSASNTGLRRDAPITHLDTYGTNIFASAGGAGVFISIDYGMSWYSINAGFPMDQFPVIHTLAVGRQDIFAGMRAFSIWQRSLSEIDTSAKKPPVILPANYSLGQNYPNPFNPSTVIQFSLPSQTFVSLKVYDCLGREVGTLISEELPAGEHSIQWNAENSSSGIYFCRLQTSSFTSTIKMILLR